MYIFFYAVFCFVATAALGGIVEMIIGSISLGYLCILTVALIGALGWLQLGKYNSTMWDVLAYILEYPDNCPSIIRPVIWLLVKHGISRLPIEQYPDGREPSEYRRKFRLIKNLWKPVGVEKDNGKRTVFNLVAGENGHPYYELAIGIVEIEQDDRCLTFDEKNIRELYKELLTYYQYDVENNPLKLKSGKYENKNDKPALVLDVELSSVQGKITPELSLTKNENLMFVFQYIDSKNQKHSLTIFDNQVPKICKQISKRLRNL